MARVMKDSGVTWIGEIPEDWDVSQFKYLIVANDGGVWGNDPFNDENDKIVIRSTEQTIDGKWCIENPAKRSLVNENLAEAKIIENDLLMTKSSGSSEHIGKTTIADSYFKSHECYFSNFIQRIRCNTKKYNPTFCWYILNSVIARKQFAYLQNSTSGLGNINSEIINRIRVPQPSFLVQQRIIDFLDRKCQQIDSVLEKTRKSIEEYKKLKNAVITQAVTKGIRPNRKMKDSGIDWIGEIPEDWNCFYLFQIFNPIKNKNINSQEKNLLSLSYGKIVRKNIETTFGLLPESFDGYNIIQKDDIVLRLTDLQNDHKSLRVGLAKETGIITSAYLSLRMKSKGYANYYYYLLHNFDILKGFYGMGAGVRQGLNWSEVRELRIAAPVDKEEQIEIAEYLDNKCSQIDNLISKKEQLITELETYKKSLIYEYVTGKKEVL